MKYLRITCVFIFLACLIAVGQVNQIWYKKGKVLYAVPVAGIDSVTYGQFLSADTFFIVIDRASRRIVYDTIDVHVPGMVFHDTIHTTRTVHLNPGRRIGVFSVAKDRQVSFSQGNLQYIQNQNIWKFADQQYEYIGAGNVKDGVLANKIDLFGWSADNTTAPFGVSASTKAVDYAGDFVDWGVNEINGEAPNTWRTLSQEEWNYIFEKRKNAKQLYSKGSIDGVRGMIVLPDNWVLPEGLHFTAAPNNLTMDLDINVYTKAQWEKMEEAGAVFLCPTGRRDGLQIGYLVEYGGYWSSSRSGNHVKHLYFNYKSLIFNTNYNSGDYSFGFNGRAVRLVHDTIVPPPAPCRTIEVNGVKFNMMCVEGGTFMMGSDDSSKEKPMHQVTVSDFMIGETEVTQELWQAVMGSNPSRFNGVDNPVEFVSWSDCQKFIANINRLTGKCFRLPTEAEWEYAACGGNASVGYKFAGSDNIDKVGWYTNNSQATTHPVATKSPNELGIYDMSGNVWEWCQDWYGDYGSDIQINPQGSLSGSARVIRGGSWMNDATTDCRVSRRLDLTPMARTSNLGFRLVLDAHEYVDLGLSVMWATTNVGATAPEEYGDYFAWGEVKSKDVYSWETYKWCDGTKSGITKYNAEDGLTTLLPEDDVAYVNWGGEWRMPTKNELTELRERCTWEWTIVNGVNGCRVTGPNGNSIFLPAAGSYNSFDDQLNSVGSIGWLFSSDRASNLSVHELGFSSTGAYQTNCSRCVGLTIRPVIPTDRKYIPEYVDMGLSVKWASCNLGASIPNGVGDFYAWGETTPKDSYTVKNYKWCNGSANAITKYCTVDTLGNNGFTDGLTTLQLGDDAAYMQKGGKWRMPTDEEWDELRTQCTWTLTEKQGMSGYEVTSKINGNTIFIPVAGFRSGENIVLDYIGAYWSSSLNESKQTCALGLYINKNENRVGKYFNSSRLNGFLIRPVYDDIPDPCQVVRVNDTLSINMMCVEGGTFMMGASDDDLKAQRDEKPQHQVTITYDYKVMQTEVTQGLWEAVMGEDIYDLIAESPYPDSKPISTMANFPVGYVRLYQCLEFIDSLNARTGLHFRMPTEAEWEFAARGGHRSKGFLYSGSDDMSDVAHINYGIVAKLRPNELGIYDMSGNIAEMTLDYLVDHETGYPSAEAQVNPRRISSSGNRAVRGLKRFSSYVNLRISHRSAYTPSWCGPGMGFRLVLPEERDFRTIYVNGVYFDMAFVEGGTFVMGDDSSDNASPAHQVTLSDYYIGQTEVTQALWKAVMGTNPSKFSGNNLPVECVSWEDCQLFVQKLREMTGLHFRLPTEAEWEFAARGGVKSRGYVYAGSDDVDSVAWYGVNSGQKTHSIAGKKPNELGIYDMSGNVWEWCQDWHEPYTAESQENPQGASEGEKRVLRGCAYDGIKSSCYVLCRVGRFPNHISNFAGLRIVLDISNKNE